MRTSIFGSNTLQIELAINRERLRFSEEKIRTLEEKVRISEDRCEQASLDLVKKDQALDHMRADLYDQRLRHEVAVKDLEQTRNLLKHTTQTCASKSKIACWLAGIATCIGFFASMLSNFGAGFFFSTPPNAPLTYITLGLASIFSILAVIMTVIVTKGE